jgi:hypothetical protein
MILRTISGWDLYVRFWDTEGDVKNQPKDIASLGCSFGENYFAPAKIIPKK